MPIDRARLSELRRYEDAEAGVSEEFLDRRLGSRRAFALLSAPLGEQRPLGWVLAPSIGPEHGNLRRFETLVARELAAAGFPTLRIRPDLHPVHGAIGAIDVSARIEEVDEAVETLAQERGLEAVGLAGALVGGTVAALAADRLGAPALALVEPVTRGRQYVRETIRRQAIAELIASVEEDGDGAGGNGSPPPADDSRRPLEELEERGATTIRGLVLTKREHDRIAELSLVDDLRSFAGRSLLVSITPTGAVPPGLRKLAERLESLGGTVTVEPLQDPLPAPFGEYYFRNAGPVRIDTRLELDRRIAALTARWAGGGEPGSEAAVA